MTAASFASSKVLIASYRPRQLDEADKIAVNLLASNGVDPRDAAAGFAYAGLRESDGEWVRELRQSVDGLTGRFAALPLAPTIQ